MVNIIESGNQISVSVMSGQFGKPNFWNGDHLSFSVSLCELFRVSAIAGHDSA